MTAAAGRVRAFVALEIPSDVRARLTDVARDLADRLPALRTIPEENIHLTLRFLGASRPEVLERLADGLGAVAAECEPAVATVSGLGTFPPGGRARVLWAGLDLPPRFAALQRRCERLARDEGYAAESRPFAPHLTLGRWREPAPVPPLPALDPTGCPLGHVVLFRSDLFATGPRYTPLLRFGLGSGR